METKVTDSPKGPEVRLYFNDDGPVMAGFLIAVTTSQEASQLPSFEEGRTLSEYFYEPLHLASSENLPPEQVDTIWLVLEGWDIDVSCWENFEPGGIGAALTRQDAEAIKKANTEGNYLVIGLKNGWRYGHDPVPELTYPATFYTDPLP